MLGQPRGPRRGFALSELGAVVVVVALTAALVIPAARRARLGAWDAVDSENLHRFAASTTAYAADNEDRYWTFSWQGGMDLPTDYEDLKGLNGTDQTASAAQAIDILRRKAGREDIQPIGGWFAHLLYNALPLYDYLNQELPAIWGVSPADRLRSNWAHDPGGFDQGAFLPCQPPPTNANKRWPYSSSYQLPTAFYDQSFVGTRIYQAGAENLFAIPGGHDLLARRLPETAFPSQKVHLHSGKEDHLGEYGGEDCEAGSADSFLLPDSRVAILFADGHTGLMKTSDANPGWEPNSPNSPEPTWIGEHPGVYRWTRNYLKGRDFGGPEVGPPP